MITTAGEAEAMDMLAAYAERYARYFDGVTRFGCGVLDFGVYECPGGLGWMARVDYQDGGFHAKVADTPVAAAERLTKYL